MRPEFRAAGHLAAEMRGFDLGDDARLLGLDLPPLKRGILLYRAGRWQEAQDLLEQADGPAAGFLSCFCTARLRTLQAALDSLPWSTDEDLDEATLGWGKGELLWAAGRLEEAEQALAFSACLGASRDLARLRYAQGRFSDALEAYRLLGREEPVLGALLHLAQGDTEEARRCLELASSAQLNEARKDPRLRALKIPRRGRSRDRQSGLEMLSKKDSRLYTKRLRDRYSGAWPLGLKWTDPLWEWCQERVQKAVVVALGPARAKRAGGDLPPALVQDGDIFYLAPNLKIPPPLWPPVLAYSAAETLPFQVERALESFRNTRRPRLSLPCRTRAFMGYREATLVPSPYSGDWQEAGPHELDRHWTFSPCVDSYPWGGAYSDDPWPETIPDQPDLQLKLVARLEEVRQQAQGGISTFTMRTVASRSQISTEYHPGGCYVWEDRYHANPWPEVVDSFNARLDVSFPNDLPVDVVGALYGFEFSTLAQLWQLMEAESEPSALAGWIDLLAATGHNDLRTAYRLRRHLSHPALPVRAALANVAVRYNWMFVLRELWLKETDQAFADWMRGHYENGAPPPPLNQLGEPIE